MASFKIGTQKAKRIINIGSDIEVNNTEKWDEKENPWPLQEEWDKHKSKQKSSHK